MEWALELALIGLLVATLFHALRLERALGVLKRDRNALEELVASFNSSTQLAEQGIERLRLAADGTGRQISRQIDRASGLKDDLHFLSERAGQLADRMELLVRSSRTLTHDPHSEPTSFAATPREPGPTVRTQLATQRDSEAEAAPRLRSQAERDLLKALKMAR